ncbi:hypothetical protein MJO28_000597 [Puccinia striiformis f. sp. tritici]|uniref:RING-type domain-containing protein n=4 Tax=Puccinia striiformis TaxID=27350 RepID=A0A0L0W5Q7_9BASI|nr:hypothetical protein Pst134EB_001845 [Puccinia striiformis f. sp. tritici]KAI9601140.1 hypothetical protein H4Q26_000944 [Puccinia striiformis f. sp. tritici PST-130]KNF06864.1 hypothetical protein PSTG_00181 [Puccinia striiformis f. sp. tritici PST-78]POV99230.1 hypothetical protein PSTT_13915 [Puccinia striiformis]KAI7962503.1 hypothetical protein MJO28_000597 [Puccinia striiformis f. sp. tritici]
MNPSAASSRSEASPAAGPAATSPPHSAFIHKIDDGYDYISEPNENLICPICRSPFIDPVMCESTDHIFCQSCLIKSLEVSATCPIDRIPLSLSLVVPAPKVIHKLVDELLVSCPFKSKLGCSFVCQRDLILTHLRSHQSQLDHRALDSSQNLPQYQSAPSLDQTVSQSSFSDRHSSNFSQLRFEWHENRAILVADQTKMRPATNDGSRFLSHCPFEKFGCSFVGTPEGIAKQHLSVTSNSSAPFDEHLCRFASIQEILHCFEHLEGRNVELKEQLSRSLAHQGQLRSVLEKLKASFRQLWRSQQAGGTDSPLAAPVSPMSCGSGYLRRASILHPLEIPNGTQPQSLSPEQSSDTSSMQHSTPERPLTSGSRMTYGANGARLRRCEDHMASPACSSRGPQFYSPIGSPSNLKIRVKTFTRRGDILTPTTEDQPHELPTTAAAEPSFPTGKSEPAGHSSRPRCGATSALTLAQPRSRTWEHAPILINSPSEPLGGSTSTPCPHTG